MENIVLCKAVMLKVNLADLYPVNELFETDHWNAVIDKIVLPFVRYLQHKTRSKPASVIHQYSAGIHINGKLAQPHIHINLHTEYFPANILANYKYWYSRHYSDKEQFKKYKHSIKVSEMTDLKGCLAYPFKECIDNTHKWKVYEKSVVEPYTIQDLITYGAGVYLASCRASAKSEEKEELKLEKWGQFCKYMDDLRETPTVNIMGDLKGVCLVALEYFRQLPERTSVNAVITMCKDYAFKRGIWTDQQILDKYQIS